MTMSIHDQNEKSIHNLRGQGPFLHLLFAMIAVAPLGLGCSSTNNPGTPQAGNGPASAGSGGNSQDTGGVVSQAGQNTGGVVSQAGQNTGGVVAQGGSETGGVVPQGGSDTGGMVVVAGSVAPGGSLAPGGSVVTGGSVPKGGTTTAGGSLAPGGSVVTGGSVPKGGTTTAGGSLAPGGSVVAGGSTSKGGTTTAGGSGGIIPSSGGQTGSTGTGVCPAVGTPPTPDTTTRAKCTGSGSAGITCHFGGSIGNYDVSFNLGGTAAGQTIVQAEHLREMLAASVTVAGTAVAPIVTTAGQKALSSMTVNVRDPEGQPEWSQASNGTPGLDMYFIGAAPQLDSIAYAPTTTAVVMYILTDSTGCDQEGPGTAGWGQWLPQFFGYGLSVANYGNSGALTECSAATTPCRTDAPYYSFYDDPKMWGTVKPLIKAGDVVFIEFAHNDKNTPQAAYEKNLTTYITEVRAKGAIPVLATPIPRNNWSGGAMSGTFVNSVGVDLLASIKSVGAANNVPVVDINAKVVAAFSAKGQATVSGYYADPTTHLSTVGANFVAALIRDEIKRLNIYPLVCFLR
jgi:lysophospholipase L1-like esterase